LSGSWRWWLVPSVLGLLEAREKRVREEIARLREEAERVQAALGEAEGALQRLVDARATVAAVGSTVRPSF
jgi:F0F1-type ATP synthase membrane subunit b/b'